MVRQILVNDQVRNIFYLATSSGAVSASFGGLATSAYWTPDGKTLYVTDSATAGAGHTNTLYVYNANTGWTTYPLTTSGGTSGPQNLAVTVPSVGVYLSGNPTVAHTWCPSGDPGHYNSMIFYPQAGPDADPGERQHRGSGCHRGWDAHSWERLRKVEHSPGPISLSDIKVTIPSTECPRSSEPARCCR